MKEGESAIFECEFSVPIEKDSHIRIEWQKDGKRLLFSNKSVKYKMILDGTKCKFIVHDSNAAEDMANYELIIQDEDDHSQLKTNSKLIVVESPVQIVEELKDVSVNEGDTAKFKFKLSKPCSCQWYKIKKHSPNLVSNLKKDYSLINDATLFELVAPDDRVIVSIEC